SRAGVVDEARKRGFTRTLGMRHGVQGALEGRFVELSDLSANELERLKRTPSSALGSCRYKLKPGDAERLATLFRGEGVEALVYIGGNDSAGTSFQIGQVSGNGHKVLGGPQTIDKDLAGIDTSPGYVTRTR